MQNQAFIIAREGFKFIFISLALTLMTLAFGFSFLAFLFLGLTLFIISFFRNPNRTPPTVEKAILSPADGKICQIEDVYEPKFLNEKRKRVSIFMSVFNCHVNRFPFEGKVLEMKYHPGKFHIASVDKASELNEQHAYFIEDQAQKKYVLVQIAGWVARRIVSYVQPGTTLQAGQRFGIIQFGSRVDFYLPLSVHLHVKVGDRVKAGLSVLGTSL